MSSVTSTSSSSLGSFLNSNTLASTGSSSSNSNSSLAISGLASGFDWQSVVTQLAAAERNAETPWKNQQTTIAAQTAAYSTINDDLTKLQGDINTLKDPSFFQSTLAQSSDTTVASVSTASGAAVGTYKFNIIQLATAAQLNGSSGAGNILAPNGASNTVIGSAGFGTAVTAGTFTINGAQINVATTDTLQQVFDKISSATNNAVTASYDSTTDTISLSSSSDIVLGSATDTSNFLQAAQLYNANQTAGHTITSSQALGHVQTTASLANANLKTAIQDDGSGDGEFTVNGVLIKYNASTDNIQNILSRINSSGAGVTATYDNLNNRFVLTDKTTGDMGISIQDVAGKGNFAAATGLSTGTLQRGQNLLYTLNGGTTQLTSQSNTITSDSSGIAGLSVTALKANSTVSVSVSSDTTKISNAIQQFVTDYNAVQTSISAQQIVSTGSDGTVTPGTLTGDLTASNIASQLRSSVFSALSGLSGSIQMLSSLGIQTNGQDNTLKVTDSTALTNALTNNLNDVKNFFTDSTNGWATQVNNFIDKTIGDDGTIPNHQANLTSQTNNLSTQIANLEKKITNDSAHWTSEFQAMEQAESQINQQLQYLSSQLKSTSS